MSRRWCIRLVSGGVSMPYWGGGGGRGGLTTAGVLAPLADEFGPGEGGCARGGGGGGGGPGAGSEGVGECEAVVRPLGSHRV